MLSFLAEVMYSANVSPDAEAKYLQGQGVARQRQAIVSGLRESVLTFQRDVKDIASRDVIEVMMMTQYVFSLSVASLIPGYLCKLAKKSF